MGTKNESPPQTWMGMLRLELIENDLPKDITKRGKRNTQGRIVNDRVADRASGGVGTKSGMDNLYQKQSFKNRLAEQGKVRRPESACVQDRGSTRVRVLCENNSSKPRKRWRHRSSKVVQPISKGEMLAA